MITIFSDSVLGNIANDNAGFSSAFVHDHVQSLKGTLKSFLRFLLTPSS